MKRAEPWRETHRRRQLDPFNFREMEREEKETKAGETKGRERNRTGDQAGAQRQGPRAIATGLSVGHSFRGDPEPRDCSSALLGVLLGASEVLLLASSGDPLS